MIKEFWQERKEEKKRLKAEKKANRKNPKTREQIAYKICGVIFALFIIFGSLGYSCKMTCYSSDYSWDSLIGITDDVVSALSEPVDESILLPNGKINEVDWSLCIESLNNCGIDIVTDFSLDEEKIQSDTKITENLNLTNRQLGALIKEYIKKSNKSEYVTLLDFNVNLLEQQYYMDSIVKFSLKNYIGSSLPDIYIATHSTVTIYDKKIYVGSSELVVNNLPEDKNAKVLEVLNGSIINLSMYTNELAITSINSFATSISADVALENEIVLFKSK